MVGRDGGSVVGVWNRLANWVMRFEILGGKDRDEVWVQGRSLEIIRR